jgi:hypothetical protein
MDPLNFLNQKVSQLTGGSVGNSLYDTANQLLSNIPGLTSPRYAGGQIDRSQPRTGESTVDRKLGQPAILGGKTVYWAGPSYKWQTAGSYKSLYGSMPSAVSTPPPVKPSDLPMPSGGSITDATPSPSLPSASDISSSAATAAQPPGGVQQPGAGTTIPQSQEPVVGEAIAQLKQFSDPDYLARLGQDRLRRLLAAEFVTSELRSQREKDKYAKEVEIKNIESWRDLQVAATEANARKEVALASTIATAMAPNTALAQAMTQQYQAAMAPFNLRRG